MKNLRTSIRRIVSVIAAMVCVISIIPFTGLDAQASSTTGKVPITFYAISTGRTSTYHYSNGRYSYTGYIDAVDCCKVLRLDSNGYCLVQYPTRRGYRQEYVRTNAIFQNENFSTREARMGVRITAYRRSNLSQQIGTIFADDTVIITGTTSYATQLLYPVSGGYKLGWVRGVYNIPDGNSGNGNGNQNNNSGNGGLVSPVPSGAKFSMKTRDSGWYGYHDINRNVNTGTPVYAVADGTITCYQAFRTYGGTRYLTSYANFIQFRSSDGQFSAKYCHLSGFNGVNQIIPSYRTRFVSGSEGKLNLGSRHVSKGELIGYIGQTGYATGPHLHFELYRNGYRIDPTSVIGGLV